MRNNAKIHRYIEWINPEEMHETTLEWLSELSFIKDEQCFLNYLIKHYSPQLMDKKFFKQTKDFVEAITEEEGKIEAIITRIQKHQNGLEIMMDEKDELDLERHYRNEHHELLRETSNYFKRYKDLKTRLFAFIAEILKKEKSKRLLN
ncbi:hypothetical protein [Eudoraea chungangensis]|uniref:hypothetical protein n=1 Tax=Eudoraea chungangensis TaxID=1481905 RepID=UPI0023ED9B87|nr:hypothetical protein [Eudoraea chungangensis]